MVGESAPGAAPLTSFTCESCGAAVAIRAKGLTVTAACPNCGAVSDSDNGTFKLVEKAFRSNKNVKPILELGVKAKFRGQVWQVIGFMRRFEKNYEDQPWDEYLLFNPFNGYCWLSVNNGHWTLFKVIKGTPKAEMGRTLQYLGDSFQIYHQGNATVKFVSGEFYWQVRIGDTVETVDAIRPPYMLSKEVNEQESIWSLGEYIPSSEVQAAFHPTFLPSSIGVAPNQPTASVNVVGVWMTWIAVFFLLFFIQLIGFPTSTNKPIYGTSVLAVGAGVTDVNVASFSTTASSSHVTIDVSTSLSQSWATVGLRLVSDDPAMTTVHTFEKDLSNYFGYDDGESWTEDNRSEEFLVNKLPRGNYKLLLTASTEAGHSTDVTTKITIKPGIWSNFWLAIFLITLPPAWITFRSRSLERKRWSDSEYNPFSEGND